MHKILFSFALILIFGLWMNEVHASEPVSIAEGTPINSIKGQNNSFDITVVADGRAVIGEQVSILVGITNNSSSSITIQKLSITPLGVLTDAFKPQCPDETYRTIHSGETYSLNCTLDPIPFLAWINPKFLIIKESEFTLQATLKIASHSNEILRSFKVNIGRSEIDILIGAVIGSLLASIFISIPISDQFKQTSRPNDFSIKKGFDIFWAGIQYIKFLLLRMLSGGIVCTLLLVFANTNRSNSLPISLSIENFWGGLLIGLFSIPVSKWLSTKMSEEITSTSGKQD